MAITATTPYDARVLSTTGQDGGNGNYTSGTWSATAGTTLVAFVRFDFQSSAGTNHFANIPTPVTSGITWTLAKSADPASGFTACIGVYVADCPSTLTNVTFAQTSTGNTMWNGSGAEGVSAIDLTIRQYAGAAAASSIIGAFFTTTSIASSGARDPGALSGTLSGSPASTSITEAVFAGDSNPSTSGGTAGSGWSIVSTFNAGNPNPYLHSVMQTRAAGSTSSTVAWTAVQTGTNTYDYSHVGVEIVAAGSGTNASAGLASGTGTANQPTILKGTLAPAGLPAGTGTAQTPGPSVKANAGLASGTGTAQQPSIVSGKIVNPGLASGAGTAQTPTVTIKPAGGLASGTGTANQPTMGGAALVPTSVSGRHLLDQNGDPILIKTLSCWGMVQNLSAANRPGFLDQVVANGYNSITIAMFGGHYDTDWNRYQDAAGNNAFSGTPWASSLGTAWNTVVAIVDDCASRGLFVNLSLYSGFNADNGIVDDITAVTAAQARTCGSAVATLMVGKSNIVWHLGLDSLTYSKTNLDAFFHGVVDVEGVGARLMWCEPAGSSPGDSANNQGVGDAGNGWTYFIRSMNSRYDYDDQATVDADIVWAQSSEPVIDCEPPYVGAGHYSGSSGTPNAAELQELRERKWCDYLRGYIGINDGHEMIWPFGKTGLFTVTGVTYDTALASTPMQQLAYVNDFVDTHCADTTWAPSSSFVTTGVGSTDTKAGVGASDTAAAAYFPTNRTVVVDTTIIAGTGPVSLYWLDPTDGSTSSIATSEAQNASRSVTYPSNHADGTSDFVLVVEALPSTNANAGVASGTGTAQTPAAKVSPNSGAASGTGTAQAPTAKASPSSGIPSGTGTAQTPGPDVKANAGVASGTGTAQTPTVQTGIFTNASAGLASGTGTAQTPSVTVKPAGGVASGTGTANQPTVSTAAVTNANAGVASGTGTASTAALSVKVSADVAAGVAIAYTAQVSNGGVTIPSTPPERTMNVPYESRTYHVPSQGRTPS